jgi:hypothetical protein
MYILLKLTGWTQTTYISITKSSGYMLSHLPKGFTFSDTTACRSLEPGGLIQDTDWCGCPVYGIHIKTSIKKVIKKIAS